VEWLGNRPWHDLVAVQDYFAPVSDLNLVDRLRVLGPDSNRVQVAELLPFLNPDLRSLGDFISRTLLIRIDYWLGILRPFWVRCQTALQAVRREESTQATITLSELWQRLRENSARLRQACLGGDSGRKRKACIVLLQVHACYRSHAALAWLGLPAAQVRSNRLIRYRLENRNDVRIAEEVAAALVEIGPMYRTEIDIQAIAEDKIRSHRLVLIEGPGQRAVYWEGEQVEADWFRQAAQWELLTVLVEGAKFARGVDAFDLPGKDRESLPTGRGLKDRRCRLKQLLPASLNQQIHSAGRGTYRLVLRPEEVCLLRPVEQERLMEVRAGESCRSVG
jgi:hypothetical protein